MKLQIALLLLISAAAYAQSPSKNLDFPPSDLNGVDIKFSKPIELKLSDYYPDKAESKEELQARLEKRKDLGLEGAVYSTTHTGEVSLDSVSCVLKYNQSLDKADAKHSKEIERFNGIISLGSPVTISNENVWSISLAQKTDSDHGVSFVLQSKQDVSKSISVNCKKKSNQPLIASEAYMALFMNGAKFTKNDHTEFAPYSKAVESMTVSKMTYVKAGQSRQ